MRLYAVFASCLLFFSAAAHADTYTTFNLVSTFSDGGTLTGTLVLDTTTNLFSSANLIGSGFGFANFNGTYDYIGLHFSTPPQYQLEIDSSGPADDAFDFALPVSTLSGYMGSSIAFGRLTSFDTAPSTVLDLASGTILPQVIATPEPSSLLLLTTGLATLCLTLRRRFS